MFIFGSPEQMKERLDAFVAGGITLPILTPITTPDKLGELIEALAPASQGVGSEPATSANSPSGSVHQPAISSPASA